MVREGTYIVIQSWMINDLQLKDKELMLYALIYGFCQSGDEQWCTCSLSYMSDWVGVGRTHIGRYLQSLIDKGLIEKKEEYFNGVKFCKYRCVKGGVTTMVTGLPKREGGVTTVGTGVTNMVTNKDNNKINNNIEVVVNSELAQLDLSEEEKGKLEAKEDRDHQYLKDYPNVLPYMQVIAVEVLKSMLIYDENVVSEAQDIFYAGLNTIKKGSKQQKGITGETLALLWKQALNICDPEVFTDIHKDKLSYFIGVVKNVIG